MIKITKGYLEKEVHIEIEAPQKTFSSSYYLAQQTMLVAPAPNKITVPGIVGICRWGEAWKVVHKVEKPIKCAKI